MEWLNIREDGVYIDCTVGTGGHSERIAERLGSGRLLALDRDSSAVAVARVRLRRFPNVTVLHENYAGLALVLGSLEIHRVDGVLIDAGISSLQLEDPSRGFSFQLEGPLDMRMDTASGITAREYLHRTSEEDLAQVLREYGDVGPAKRIAAAIVKRRSEGLLSTTRDLAEAVADALRFVPRIPEEVRTVFQAIRMAVNDELRALEYALKQAILYLNPGGRLVVISFHSGEDRVVKNLMREASRPLQVLHPDGRVHYVLPPRLRLLTRRPVQPGEEELLANPRAHSAKLRAAERLAEEAC